MSYPTEFRRIFESYERAVVVLSTDFSNNRPLRPYRTYKNYVKIVL